MLLEILERHHFTCYKPHGAYYIMTDISGFGFGDDVEFARYLVKDVGVAAVPGSSFYKNTARGRTKLRFCYCKRDETLAEADRRLAKLRAGRACESSRLAVSTSRTIPKYIPFSVNDPVSVSTR